MKLTQMIEIADLVNEVDYITYKYNKEEKLNTLLVLEDGIHLWEDSDISSFETFDSKILQYETSKNIEKFIKSDYKRYELYYALYSILRDIGVWKKSKDRKFDVETYIELNFKSCIGKVIKEIESNLDFTEIISMDNLIPIIKEDTLYQQLMFRVTEYSYAKERRGYKSPIENKYSFGNIKYHEDLDIVDIHAYKDCVELSYRKKGYNCYETKINNGYNKEITIESKIMTALDKWRCSYTN
jgi:hypothetical protein